MSQPLAPKGGKDTRVGYYRPGYSDGGWQFSFNLIDAPLSAPVTFNWAGRTLTANLRFAP